MAKRCSTAWHCRWARLYWPLWLMPSLWPDSCEGHPTRACDAGRLFQLRAGLWLAISHRAPQLPWPAISSQCSARPHGPSPWHANLAAAVRRRCSPRVWREPPPLACALHAAPLVCSWAACLGTAHHLAILVMPLTGVTLLRSTYAGHSCCCYLVPLAPDSACVPTACTAASILRAGQAAPAQPGSLF